MEKMDTIVGMFRIVAKNTTNASFSIFFFLFFDVANGSKREEEVGGRGGGEGEREHYRRMFCHVFMICDKWW